jgi:hypothetical protein
MALTVTGLDPASAPEGTLVVITGTDFTEDTSRVRFGTYDCGLNYTVISDTEISCVVPAGTGTQYVLVTTPAGTNPNGAQFTFATYEGGSNNAPTISSVTPSQTAGFDGEGGDSVVIAGTYLTTTRAVFFGPTLATAVQATFTVNSSVQVTAIAPRGEPGVQAYVFLETNYGTVSTTTTANDFLYQSSAIPTVTGLTPATALPGFEVTVTGTNFTYTTAVRVGTLYASFVIVDATTIRFIVPGDTTFLGSTAEVYVSNFWGESTTHATLTYATAGTLRTTLSLSTGTPAMSPRDGWIVTSGSITCTLTATYTPWSLETYVESKWYRRDNDAPARYTGTFTVTGEGSHKIEFWSVGKDGVIETANVRYVNIVATATPTLTATAGIGQISFSWTAINIPGVYYTLYYGASNPPSTNPTTLNGCAFVYMIAPGTNVYARVRVYGPDGADYGYSNVTGPTQSNGVAASDLADNAITSAKLAPDITPPPIFASDPAVGGYVNGDYYYNSTDKQLHILSGGAWTHASAQSLAIIGQAVAGTIAAAAIGATEIAADSIFAKHLIVADYENLVANASSELALPSGLSYPVAYDSAEIEFRGVINTNANRGNNCRRVTGNTAAVYLTLCDPVPAKAGDVFRISVKSKVGTTGTAQVAIAGVNASGSDVATPTASTGTTSTSYQSDGPPIVTDYVEYTVPTGSGASAVVAVRAYLMYTGAAATYGYFDDILFRKMLAGELVVDGAITAAKIAANTITATSGCIASLNADWLTAGVIDAVDINGVDITGCVITAGAATSACEINIADRGSTSASIELWSGMTGEDFPGSLLVQDLTTSARVNLNGVQLDEMTRPSIDMISGTADYDTYIDIAPGSNCNIRLDNLGASGDGEISYTADSGHTFTGITYVAKLPRLRHYSHQLQHEFIMPATSYATGAYAAEFYSSDINNGLAAAGGLDLIDGGAEHPGVIQYYSASTGGGASTGNGRMIRTNIDAFFPRPGDIMEFVIYFPSGPTSLNWRGGIFNAWSTTDTSTLPTLGCWLRVYGNGGTAGSQTLRVYGYSNATATTGYATLNEDTWYTLRIEVGTNTATFTAFTENGSAVTWSNNTASATFSDSSGFGVYSYNTAVTNVYMMNLDYMALSYRRDR